MVAKYQDTLTISYYSAGTTNSLGVWTPGTLNTVRVTECDIQPVSERLAIGDGGAVLNYNWHIFMERFTGDSAVPNTAKLTFFSAEHLLVLLHCYTTHVEIKCRD